MRNYIEYPLPFGINVIRDFNENNLYQIAKSQTAVFPFKLNPFSAIRVEAGHSSFYDNQAGTISAWPSDQINGRSITGYANSNQNRINIQGEGFSWLFHPINADLRNYKEASISQWIDPNREYYMCFQNLENKDNGLYLKFTYIP